jgi:hypothetical protein
VDINRNSHDPSDSINGKSQSLLLDSGGVWNLFDPNKMTARAQTLQVNSNNSLLGEFKNF